MGCTPSNTSGFKGGKRKIKVGNVSQRLKAAEKIALQAMFDRIQQGSTINFYMFQNEVVGTRMPEVISSIIYCLFASPIPINEEAQRKKKEEQREVWNNNPVQGEENPYIILNSRFYRTDQFLMTLQDLQAMYIVFNRSIDNETAELCFYLVYWLREQRIHFNGGRDLIVKRYKSNKSPKQTRGDLLQEQKTAALRIQQDVHKLERAMEMLTNDDMLFYTEQVVKLNENDLDQFYERVYQERNKPISKQVFTNQFKYIGTTEFFTYLPQLMKGYTAISMNVPITIKNDKFNGDRSLTMNQFDQAKAEAESQGLTNEEVQNIQQFYDTEIKGKDAKTVLKVFSRMFRDVKHPKLRKYLMESASQVHALNFTFLCNLALFMCRKDTESVKLEFLFGIFTKQRTSSNLKKTGLRDFLEIFNLNKEVFPNPQQVSKRDFIHVLDETMVDFDIIYGAKYMMIALMQLTPQSDEEERMAILAVLNQNPSIETFIYENLHEEKQFYVLEKKFWDDWCASMSFFTETGKFSMKKDTKTQIKNARLLEPRHNYRMQEVVYNEDFVLLPKHVFFPLCAWYSCDKVITRDVISWRTAAAASKPGQFGRLDSMGSRNSARFMMSNQKFYNPQEETFDVDLQKKVGDTVFELEVYPKLVYISKITDKGIKEHENAFVNRKLNQAYLKKYSASKDSLPFEELQLSKKTTLHNVLSQAAKLYGQNAKKGRLHIDGNLYAGVQLIVSLEDCALREGTLVYVEFANEANEWPSDKTTQKELKGSELKLVAGQSTAGLINLGNTCYMNSALQCMVNLKPIYDYFVQSDLYRKQVNMQNVLGHQGELVQAFANLAKRMWQQPGANNPREFKQAVSNCAESFSGFDQQDSQEYLAFLIDGLHEELNLRKKKPYIENPESEGRKTTDLGLEFWSNSLRRDWSFIFFTFYGMMRSKLNCKQCTQETSTFEAFSQMSVSLPEPAHQVINVIVHRLPNKVREQITGKQLGAVQIGGDQDSGPGGMLDLDSGRNSHDTHSAFSSVPQRNRGYTVGQRVNSSESTRERHDSQKFTESFTYNTNDLPIRIAIKVDNEITFREIHKKICQIREVNIDPTFVKSQLVMGVMEDKILGRVLHLDEKLAHFGEPNKELHAFEMVSRIGRNMMVSEIENMERANAEVDHHIKTWNAGYKNTLGIEKRWIAEREKSSERMPKNSRNGELDYVSFMHYQMYRPLNMKQEEALHRVPKDILIACYQRRFVKKDNPFLLTGTVQIVMNMIMINLPTTPTSRMLYEEIWGLASIQLKADSPIRNSTTPLWWQVKNFERNIKKKTQKGNLAFEPFCLRSVQKDGLSCSVCHWKLRCSGCLIMPTDENIPTLLSFPFIAIDWHPVQLEQQYNPTSNELLEHVSVEKLSIEAETSAQNVTSLDDCLVKYHKREELEDSMNCKTCKSSQIHYKTVDLFQPPPVLIIQLKRFKAVPNTDRFKKLTAVVDFPIFNLDMSGYIVDKDLVNRQLGLETKYDLTGFVNHMGTLGNGHYTANVRNPFTRKWHVYDDHHVTEIQETSMTKEHAYLLFYVRKDMQGKGLRAAFPNIESDYFPGKPIITKSGQDGFVIGVHGAAAHRGSQKGQGGAAVIVAGGNTPNPDEVTIKLIEKNKEGESLNVRQVNIFQIQIVVTAIWVLFRHRELQDEKDKDTITYNKNELDDVAALRNRKLTAQNLQRSANVEAKSEGCCKIMCCFSRKGAVDHATESEEDDKPLAKEEFKSNTIKEVLEVVEGDNVRRKSSKRNSEIKRQHSNAGSSAAEAGAGTSNATKRGQYERQSSNRSTRLGPE